VAKYQALSEGEPAPWFRARTSANPSYAFDTVGGRYVVLCFLGSASLPPSQRALAAIASNRALFDDDIVSLFIVSNDTEDEKQGRLKDALPGIRVVWDGDAAVAKKYGAINLDAGEQDAQAQLRPMWMVLDPTLRILHMRPMAGEGQGQSIFDYLRNLPPPARYAGFEVQAPVLILPNVFEADFCRKLISLYDEHGGEESGFMREIDGKTVKIHDHNHKRRKDHEIKDAAIIKDAQTRILRRVVPEIMKVHQFHVTRMERYIVCCYSAEDKGHFNSHRDNTTAGTAHRRFAVSINLNADFDGGEVSFPEYGPRSFKAPPGGAVVFSCSLLHRVSQVTRGRRYAFLPFLYDDAAAKVREANNKFLGEGVGAYSAQRS